MCAHFLTYIADFSSALCAKVLSYPVSTSVKSPIATPLTLHPPSKLRQRSLNSVNKILGCIKTMDSPKK